jgi:acyl carrier protein
MTNSEKLVNAFSDALAIDAAAIKDSLTYQSIPEWDSISHMVLISRIEEAFDVSLDTDDVIALSSVARTKEILKKYNIIC